MSRKLFLRARDGSGDFSSLKDLIEGGLKKDILEIAGSDLYLRIRPMEEVFVVFEGEPDMPVLNGPIFEAELLGLTAEEARPIYYDSLKAGFFALLSGIVDYLQLYGTYEPRGWNAEDRNYHILFLKKGRDGQIQFSSGKTSGSERFILTWEAGARQGKVARFRELAALPAVPKVPAN